LVMIGEVGEMKLSTFILRGSLFTGAIVLAAFAAKCASATDVVIPDSNLESALRATLNIPTGTLHDTDLAALTTFSANGVGVVDLSGLEYCTGLTSLFMTDNQIADLSPLSGLDNLLVLGLSNNQIEDISDLAALSNLQQLVLETNHVANLTPLA